MENSDLAKRHLIADKMDVDLNVLRAAMLNGVGRHVDNTNVVSIDHSRQRDRNMKLLQELPQPAALSYGVSNSTVLNFCAGA